MFTIILSMVAMLMQGYLTWRISSLKWFGVERRRIWLISLLVWLIFTAAIQFGHDAGASPYKAIILLLEQLALDWLGALFIATTVMLAVDLVTGFGLWVERRARPYLAHLHLGALVVAALLIVVAMVQGSRPPLVVLHEVVLESLPTQHDGSRLVVLSDLHLGSQLGPNWLAARVTQVEALKPDIIILLGDIFEGHGKPNPELQPIFARLTAPLGVYAVTGNHEFHGDSAAAIAMSETAGVEWLRNRVKAVAPGLLLAGVDDLSQQRINGDTTDRITALFNERPEAATVLLSHSPLQVEHAASAGVGLMLSGHTHNGQIWPFNYLVQQFYPYMSGVYLIADMTLLVNRGTGLWGPRMRLWQPAEIIEVTLRNKPAA